MFGDSSTISEVNTAGLTRGQFLKQLQQCSDSKQLGYGLEQATRFIGASGYLLLRNDGAEDVVVSSNWPYDLAKNMGVYLLRECAISGQFSDDFPAFEAKFIEIPDAVVVPDYMSKLICVLPISSGDSSFLLSFLFKPNGSHSRDRLMDVGLACAYFVTDFGLGKKSEHAHSDLTEREMECLTWIAKGKTSDEIALIIGISKNTVNNYITSIMNKTATKSRAEAVAEAVRSEII